MEKHTSFLHLQTLQENAITKQAKSPRKSLSLSFLVLSNFSGAFDLLVVDEKFPSRWFYRVVSLTGPLLLLGTGLIIKNSTSNPSTKQSLPRNNTVSEIIVGIYYNRQETGYTYLSTVDAISAIYHQQIETIQRSETFVSIEYTVISRTISVNPSIRKDINQTVL